LDAQIVTCNSIGVYEHALTRGRHYEIVDQDEDKYRIIGDNGKRVWISKGYFEAGKVPMLIMKSWQFDDDIETDNFVEITITFNNGTRRWCDLTTPKKLVEHFKNPIWIHQESIRSI
jgi:5-carboxymethyl-2-hydroxymuconate isomerase